MFNMFKIYGSTQKYFFTNAYVRSLLELSISFLHRCVNMLAIDSLNEFMNLNEFICIPNILRFPSLIKPGSFEDRANRGTPIRETNGI